MSKIRSQLAAAVIVVALSACGERPQEQDARSDTASGNDERQVRPEIWPKAANPVQPDSRIEQRVSALLAAMTLEEKVGQVIQADIGSITPAEAADYHQALSGPVMMGMACGKGCNVEFPLDISAAEVSQWTTRTIKPRCFEDRGLDLRNIDKPFYLHSAGINKLSISFIGLETSAGGTTC